MNRQSSISGITVLVLLLLAPLALGAWDTRLFSLSSPTLSLSGAVPAGFINTIFPTDEFGLGLSAVADPIDVFTLPQQLANAKLFPSSSVIVDGTVVSVETPNGGIVLGLQNQQLVLGLFLLRPSLNGWVTGAPRSNLTGLGGSYSADSGVGVVAPTVPTNLVDLIVAAKLGTMLVGAGAGFSYSQAANGNASIVGTADSTTTDRSSSWVITGRAGASLPLGPVSLDVSTLLLLANSSATRVSGAAATIPNLNNTLSAMDFSFSVNGRATMALAQTLDMVALGEFAFLPQGYTAANAAGPIANTTNRVDPAQYMSFGGGAGLNWKPVEAVLINGLLTVIYGNGSWVSVNAGVTPRPTSTVGWVTLRPVLDAELKPAGWITLRAGVSGFITWVGTSEYNGAGTALTATGPVQTGVGANAGFGFQFTEKTALDVLLNLANFDGTAGFVQVPGLSASLKVDL